MPGNRYSKDALLKCIGFEQIVVSTVAIGFTIAKLSDSVSQRNAIMAEVTIDSTANTGIRHRRDGTAPTSAVGAPTPIATYNTFQVWGVDDLKNFLAIRGNQGTPADTTINVTYFA